MPRKADARNIARRKEQIVKAAIRAFAKKGLKDTSMDDIVRESGLSKGAIYWYFKSKDELIVDLMSTFFNSDMPELKRLTETTGPASAQLKAFLDLAAAEVDKMMGLRPVIQELYVLALRDRTVRKIVKREFETYHRLLETIIERGIRQGEFKETDPHQIANSIISLMEGTVVIWSIGVKDIDMKRQMVNGGNCIIASIRK